MARKSRKNMPVAVAEPTDNLTAKAVLSMDKEAKPYQVGIYARLSFESEANKERDTVDTQIAYIREFINSQDDMVEVEVYADISVTGTTFERPEFDRMIQDIRAGRINTVITRDLSRLGRNYVEAGNYIERVFPFLDVRYIAITDDFDTARPGTDLSVPLKNIVNEYYSKDLSKKVETGKHSIWAQGGFSEGTPPYGYYRATDGSRKLLIDEEVSDNVVRIFNMFLDGEGYGSIAKTMQSEGILSPPKYRFYKAGKTEFAEKAREWHYSHVKEILQGEYYIGNIVHGKQRKALDTGRKNKKTDKQNSSLSKIGNFFKSTAGIATIIGVAFVVIAGVVIFSMLDVAKKNSLSTDGIIENSVDINASSDSESSHEPTAEELRAAELKEDEKNYVYKEYQNDTLHIVGYLSLIHI